MTILSLRDGLRSGGFFLLVGGVMLRSGIRIVDAAMQ